MDEDQHRQRALALTRNKEVFRHIEIQLLQRIGAIGDVAGQENAGIALIGE